VSAFLTVGCRRVAPYVGAVASCSVDRWHRAPVPLLGGAAIALTVLLSATLVPDLSREGIVLLGAGSGLFLLGLYDDLRPLRPQTKLVGQILAASAVVGVGVELHLTPYAGVNTLLTLVWIVGITNAFNLLDNMDGLAAGIAIIAASFRLGMFALDGDPAGVALCAILIGALGGFLVFNFAPASIFMGDAGSLFVGFTVASLSLVSSLAHTRGVVSVLLFPVLILLVPIFDTILVTITRVVANRAISVGGRDHTSHRLVQLGLSERQAVLLLYGTALLAGGVAFFARVYGLATGIVLIVFVGIGAMLGGVFLSQIRIQDARVAGDGDQFLHRVIVQLPYKRQVATVLIDVTSIVLAYYCAYLLRFEADLVVQQEAFARSLPIVVACQLAALTAFRTYRGAWRYTTVVDLVRLLRAVGVGTTAAVVVMLLLYRFEGYSRAVFVLDWILLCVFAGGTRLCFRALAETLPVSRVSERPVLVYGAGDAGAMMAREFLHNGRHHRRPIGFLDDDPRKRGLEIYGYPVLGAIEDLDDVLRTTEVSELVLATRDVPDDRLERVRRLCRKHGVEVVRLVVDLR
jgi:UDP-GlcNAc:undecaprenyl-phosphate GlcNAc-1-phosphate transferase